uniref:Viral Atype inclusion protein putative n=1 Tax=Albugo laibachii Nc14 TaxID=890382 RepID=F0W713_9STRA|nr:viral Atype inclusion protein putative [Albugo laibachii Nc14]|eukprot:CCA16908.1 viral Atype inclusion protein putative [Albugo laibachii Nc14]
MDTNGQGDSIVLEEEIDPNYEPSEKEVIEYATWLGMNLEAEKELFWIAREGLKAPLPENWKPCKTTDTEEIYYFNFSSGESTWEHPCDEYYRNLYQEHKKKSVGSKTHREPNERKKKEQDDVAELLGKKGTNKKKKNSSRKAVDAGHTPKNELGNVMEKKPFGGLSKPGGLGALQSVKLGSASSVAELNKKSLRSEQSEVRDEFRPGPSVNLQTLSKPPLTSLGFQKGNASDYRGKDAIHEEGFETKRSEYEEQKRLLEESQKKDLDEMRDSHQEQVEKCILQFRQEVRIVQEEQERNLKSVKGEYEKKRNAMENEMDRNENAVLLDRKEKLKRIETETQFMTSVKKNELQKMIEKLERDQKSFLTGLQEKLDKDKSESIRDIQRQRDELTNELEDMKSLQSLRDENESLRCDLQVARGETGTLKTDLETLLAEKIKLQESISHLESQAREWSHSSADRLICTKCVESIRICQEWESKYNESVQTIEELSDQTSILQSYLSSAKEELRSLAANASQGAATASDADQVTSDWSLLLATLQEQLERKERELEAEISRNKRSQGGVSMSAQIEAAASKQLIDAQNKATDLSNQLENAIKRNEEAEKQIKEVTNRNNQQETRHQHEMMKAQQSIDCLTNKLSSECEAREKAESSVSKLHTEFSSLESSLRKAEERLHSQERMVGELKEERNLLLQRFDSMDQCAQDETKATENLSSEMEKQKWQVDRLQALTKSQTEEKDHLNARLVALNQEIDQLTLRLREAEAEKDRELLIRKRKEAELENLHSRLQVADTELVDSRKDVQKYMTDSVEHKAQINGLRSSERTLKDTLTSTTQKCNDLEEQNRSLEHELVSSRKELRSKCILLEDHQKGFHEMRTEKEVLEQQLDELSIRSKETKNTTMMASEGEKGSVEVRERISLLQSQLADSDMKISLLEQDRSNRAEKQRDLSRKHFEAESTLRKLEEEKQNLFSDLQNVKLEASKWKEKAEQADKEAVALNAKLMELQLEKETLEITSQNLKEAETRTLKASTTFQNTKEALEKQIQDLIQQLYDEKSAGRASAVELQGSRNRCKRLENELEYSQERNKNLENERNDLDSKCKAQQQENHDLENQTRSMHSDGQDWESKCKLLEDNLTAALEKVKRLEPDLLEQQTRYKREREEKESTIKQLRKAENEKVELESAMTSCKRRAEASESRADEFDAAVSRADFQATVKHQRLQKELDASTFTTTSLEKQNRVMTTDLVSCREALHSANTEILQIQAKLDAATKENRELKETILMINAMKSQSEASNQQTYHENQFQGITANEDVTLVKLHLADVNKCELESHLKDVTTKLEQSARRAAVMEDRCKHQAIEIESLLSEISCLRSSLQKLHLSAMEALPSTERVEYEHRKRLLRAEYLAQLGAFQDREEQAFIRNKARSRAKYEKELEELIADLERQKEQRLQHEQDLCMQLIDQLREQHSVRIRDIKRRWKNETRAMESEMKIKNSERVDEIARQLRAENEETSASMREQKRHYRAKMLEQKGCTNDDEHSTSLSHSVPKKKYALSSRKEKIAAKSHGKEKYPSISRKWERRIKAERALLLRASKIASKERETLSLQLANLRYEKKQWRQNAASSHSPHDQMMSQEMKNIIDQNALNYNTSIKRLREMENRINYRQECVHQMEKTVARLGKFWSTKNDRAQRVPGSRTISETEEDLDCEIHGESTSSEESSFSNSSSSEVEANQKPRVSAIIRKLEHIDEKLLAEDQLIQQAPFLPSSRGNQLQLSNPPDPYQMPVSRGAISMSSSGLPTSRYGLLGRDDSNWEFAQRGIWNCPRYLVPAQSAWNQVHTTSYPLCSNASSERFSGLTSYHRQINNWAQGRQKVQRAARKQATWLSNLSKEIQEYKTNTNLTNFERNTLLDEAVDAEE